MANIITYFNLQHNKDQGNMLFISADSDSFIVKVFNKNNLTNQIKRTEQQLDTYEQIKIGTEVVDVNLKLNFN